MGGNNLSHPKAHNPMISYKKLYAKPSNAESKGILSAIIYNYVKNASKR